MGQPFQLTFTLVMNLAFVDYRLLLTGSFKVCVLHFRRNNAKTHHQMKMMYSVYPSNSQHLSWIFIVSPANVLYIPDVDIVSLITLEKAIFTSSDNFSLCTCVCCCTTFTTMTTFFKTNYNFRKKIFFSS